MTLDKALDILAGKPVKFDRFGGQTAAVVTSAPELVNCAKVAMSLGKPPTKQSRPLKPESSLLPPCF